MNKFTAKILLPFCQVGDFFSFTKAGIPILLYHSISDAKSRLAVRPQDFDKQMRYLARCNYQSILPRYGDCSFL